MDFEGLYCTVVNEQRRRGEIHGYHREADGVSQSKGSTEESR